MCVVFIPTAQRVVNLWPYRETAPYKIYECHCIDNSLLDLFSKVIYEEDAVSV